MHKAYSTKSGNETKDIAKDLAKSLLGGTVIALYGDLGAGKTTFTQGLAEALGVKQHINSPTFIIHRSYRVNNTKKGIANFHHIDLYRIETKKDIESVGLEEIFQDTWGVVVIEWPEKITSLLPKKRIDIRFEYVGENERKITVQNHKSQITNLK